MRVLAAFIGRPALRACAGCVDVSERLLAPAACRPASGAALIPFDNGAAMRLVRTPKQKGVRSKRVALPDSRKWRLS
jgi:hypothetical protein